MTPLQLAVGFAIGGSVLAATVPAFLSNLRATRFAEPIDGLQRIAGRASKLAVSSPLSLAYPESVGLTPAVVPAGERVTDPAGTWEHPTWRLLDFRQDRPHFYAFEFERRTTEGGAEFTARARGDLDGDGELSLFSIVGAVRVGGLPEIYPMQILREVE